MKSALSLTLIVCLVTSALPVAAQEKMDPKESPLTRAMNHEEVRLATADEPATSGIESAQQSDNRARSDWTSVRRLGPGTQVVVTVIGSVPGRRSVVLADAAQLTVLNLTDPTLPGAAVRMLRDIASHHPEYFTGTPKTGQFVDQDVRVAPDGVFVANRRVADLGKVVETIAQRDVAELKTRRKGRGVWGHLGLLGGYFAGSMGGFLVAGAACQAAVGAHRCDGAGLAGTLLGGLAGGVYGAWAANHETEDVIYRAP